MTSIITVILFCSTISTIVVQGQNLCQFSSNPAKSVNGSTHFINNFSTNKCLRVANFGHFVDSKIFLDECSWWKTAPKDQGYAIITPTTTSISDGFVFTTDAGMGQSYCLTLTSSEGTLRTAHCRSTSLEQVWRFKAVSGQANQHLIQQVSSGKCLIPDSRVSLVSSIILSPCNSYQTEQIWKICTIQ